MNTLKTTPTHTANTIPSPVRPGDHITLPKGTIATSTNPRRRGPFAIGRATHIRVHHVLPGWVDLWNDHRHGRGYVVLPEIVWPGTGGYWTEARLTPELTTALGYPPLQLPELSPWDLSRVDVEPGFGPGYDNRHPA